MKFHMTRFFAVLWFLLGINGQVAQGSPSRRNKHLRVWLSLRGGDSSDLYELNPYYEPGASHKHNFSSHRMRKQDDPLMHKFHIETTQAYFSPPPPQLYDSYDTGSFSSITQSLRHYLVLLYANNPDLFSVAAACVAVFVLWRVPPLQSFLQKHFVCSRKNIQAGRIDSLVLAAISHISLSHLAVNIFSFLSLGRLVQTTMMTTMKWPLWPLLLGSAVTGSIAHLLFGSREGCLGLSGVTCSMVGMLGRLYPNKELRILFMGIIPLQLRTEMILRLLLIWSFVGSIMAPMTKSNVGHATHLSGLLFGMAWFEVWRKKSLGRQGAIWWS